MFYRNRLRGDMIRINKTPGLPVIRDDRGGKSAVLLIRIKFIIMLPKYDAATQSLSHFCRNTGGKQLLKKVKKSRSKAAWKVRCLIR
jgi:hypothetical protein